MKTHLFQFGLALALGWSAADLSAQRRVENFNRDWRFAKGAQPGAQSPEFDDAQWGSVRLPHDWAIYGPYQPKGDAGTGKLPWWGEGWYRKHFALPAADAGKRVVLDFDGVMANPTVYVNGQMAGGWDYGYMSFRVDATDWVRFGQTNVVAVHADTRSHSSRWYPGAGIYRKVQLVIQEPVHIALWGTCVTTPEVSEASAMVRVRTTVENHTDQASTVALETTLLDPKGKPVASKRSTRPIAPKGASEFDDTFPVAKPQRWDIKTPQLYRAVSGVLVGGKRMDSCETAFGIRTFAFTANDGFHLNGRRVQLKGVNLHHDQGPLGAAFLERAMERQLMIMKDMGVNAIRTSHNPPAPELLDLCDRLGFVVWDELFDKWDGTATRPENVSMLQHGEKQIRNFVRRDRNHPSIVIWSAGNEIWDLEGGKFENPPGLLRQMVGYFKQLDPTRPVTLAHAVPESANTPLDDCLDATGWNYARRYSISREQRPNLPIIYSESASALSTRGYYELPHPSQKNDFSVSLQISSYDHYAASWADISDTEFALMERDSFCAGEFVWTGFDYLGEPTPYTASGWGAFTKKKLNKEEEARSSYFGIVDLVGIPKDRYYLYRSYWAPEKTTVHILPHWNWPDRAGTNVPVYVYTSGNSAELFLNGKSLGKRVKDPKAPQVMDRYRLRWEEVIYEPGELKAVAYQGVRKIGASVVRTAGEPAQLRLTPNRTTLQANGDDLSYVLVEAVDQQGNLCPRAMNDVTFKVTGPATIAGVGNGDPHFSNEFVASHVPLFNGKAMLIVRIDESTGGTVRVTASGESLKSSTTVRLKAR
jgi:beta-galactosidase